jgi:hypothetical protein
MSTATIAAETSDVSPMQERVAKRPPKRSKKGQLLPGNTANPTGSNGHHLIGWQRYGHRVQKWLAMPLAEVVALAQDEKAMAKLSTIDAICVRHVVNSVSGATVLPERRELLDRIEGSPRQTVEVNGNIDISHYMAHDQAIIDRYNAKRDQAPVTIDQKPETEE